MAHSFANTVEKDCARLSILTQFLYEVLSNRVAF
jgi:hypothetical protein